MRYSKLALLSTLSGFALLTATSSSPAFAPSVTDLGLLRQQETWQVSNVDAKNAKYCAMATQFDKEISLAFARSPSGAGSLAMSFPGNILDTGMTYQVSMQVDDMQPRRYDVRATSPHSLIVQIGRDEDFYSALGGNGTLRISLPTMNMRFDLAKFSSSYISLVSCTSKLPQASLPILIRPANNANANTRPARSLLPPAKRCPCLMWKKRPCPALKTQLNRK